MSDPAIPGLGDDTSNDRTIDVGSRKQLFVDDKFISSSRGVELTMNAPAKMNQPVLSTDIPWEVESGASIDWYSSVLYDRGKVRIWGSGSSVLPVSLTPGGPVVRLDAYAESADGIHFHRPDPHVVSYDKNTAEIGQHGRIGGVSVWIDPIAPPSERYKSQAKFYPANGRPAEFHIYSSPDGYRWMLYAKPEIGDMDTQSIIFQDTSIGRYLMYTRDNPGAGTPDRRRVIRRLESQDLTEWINEVYVMDADGTDNCTYAPPTPQPPVDYYGATVFQYPEASPDSVFIMIAHTFWHWIRRPAEEREGGYDDHKFRHEVLAPATIDGRLMASRDGIHFSRLGDRKPFLPLGTAGSFSSKCTWSLPNPIRMGDELWIYYFGGNLDHDGFVDPAATCRRSAIDRAVLRLDGFVSADTSYSGGEIVTPLLTFSGSRLEVNVDPGAGGSMRVELIDEYGTPIPGFTLDDATTLCENSVSLPVVWKTEKRVGKLAGKPVKIRFVMRDCKLYAFQFVDHPTE